MLIDLVIETGPQVGDGQLTYISGEVNVKLIFKLPTATITFRSYGNSPDKAFMSTINAFLANRDFEIADHYSVRHQYRAGIQFAGHIAPELRNIIENAIDLKTGNNRNKLSEVIYRE
jgi:hypothetical protein